MVNKSPNYKQIILTYIPDYIFSYLLYYLYKSDYGRSMSEYSLE